MEIVSLFTVTIATDGVCQSPPRIANADVDCMEDISGNSKVHCAVRCRHPHGLSGPDKISCSTEGRWSSNTPVCKGTLILIYIRLRIKFVWN